MALIDASSCDCMKSELDLFSVKPTQTSIEKGQWVEYHPVSLIGDHGPLEFRIEGSEDLYIDPAETFLSVKAKVTAADGTDLPDDGKCGPVNLFLHSLFSQVDIFLNQRLISSSTPTYPYRAMIETLLSYDMGAKQSQLQAPLFYKDTAGKHDEADPTKADNEVNKGLKERASFVQGGKTVDLMGRIHCDLFHQDKYILSGVDLHIKCIRSANTFCLMASEVGADFKVVIQSASLLVRKVQLSPSVRLAHEKALLRSNVKYPIQRVLCNVFSVSQGSMNVVKDNLFQGQLPMRAVVAMVDSDAFNGNFRKSPFHFKHNQMTSVGISVNGEPLPGKPLETKFTEAGGQNFIQAYLSLFQGCNSVTHDQGNFIERSEYPEGYSLLAFDLSPDLSDGGHVSLIKRGNLKLEMRFGAPLTQTVMVIVYAVFDNLIEITRERAVLFDYSD